MALHPNYIILLREEAERPVDGHVVRVDKWWITTPEGLVYFTENQGMRVAAQCNTEKVALEILLKESKYPMEVAIERIPLVFEHRREDRLWWRKLWLRQHRN